MSATFLPDEDMRPRANLMQWHLHVKWGTESIEVAPGDIVSQPEFVQGVEPLWNGKIVSRLHGRGTMRLMEDCVAAVRLLRLAESEFWDNPEVSLFCGDDLVPVFCACLKGMEREPGAVTLRAELDWPWNARKLICRNLAELNIGSALGIRKDTWLPQVFGENDGVPAAALHVVSSARLREAIDAASTIVLLRTQIDWPTRGRVQIEDEVLEYQALQEDPPTLVNLQRGEVCAHPKGAKVVMLPANGEAVRWVAADHESEILAVRAGSPDGEEVFGLEAANVELEGRTACVLSADRFPVLREHAAWSIPFAPEPDATCWELQPETMAMWPTYLFLETGMAQGARLSTAYPQIVAQWQEDFSRRANRHDKLDALRLTMEIVAAAGWGADMYVELTVENSRGAIVRRIGFADLLSSIGAFEGSGKVEEVTVSERAIELGSPDRFVLDFDDVQAADWSDLPSAIAGSFSTWARGSTPLVARLHRQAVPSQRAMERVGLFARVRAVGSACNVEILASIPSRLKYVHSASVGTEWQTIGEWFGANGAVPDELLREDAEFHLSLPAGGEVEVAGFWIEAEVPPRETASADGLVGAQVKVSGSVRQAMAFQAYSVDVSELLDPSDPWSFLAGGDNSPRVTLRIVNAGSLFSVEIHALTWRGSVYPATRVALATKLYTHQRGRMTGLDGACAAGDVIALLHRDADFGALPEASLDGEALAAASADLEALHRRFGTWFAERRTIRDVMLEALGEAGCLLVPRGDCWALSVLDRDPEFHAPAEFTEENVLEFPGALQVEPAVLEAKTLLLHDQEGEAACRTNRSNGQGCAKWQLRWLRSGFDELARLAFERLGVPTYRISLPTDMAWLRLPLWKESRVALQKWGTESRVGHVAQSGLKDGSLQIEHRLLGRRVICWSCDRAMLRRDVSPTRLVVAIDGRVVARFTPEDLELRGEVLEGGNVPQAEEPIAFQDECVVFTINGEAFAIDSDGNLIVSGGIAELLDLADSAPDGGFNIQGERLILGTPELGIVAALDSSTKTLQLAGSIIERAVAL